MSWWTLVLVGIQGSVRKLRPRRDPITPPFHPASGGRRVRVQKTHTRRSRDDIWSGRDVFKFSVTATCRTARLRVLCLYARHPRHTCASCRLCLRASPISSQNSVEYSLPPPEICSRTEAKAYCPDTTMAYVMLCRRVRHPGMHVPLKVHLVIFPIIPTTTEFTLFLTCMSCC